MTFPIYGSYYLYIGTQLLPIFRTDAQARVLAALQLGGERESLSALAEALGIPLTTVQREVGRLELAGIVRTERAGSSRRVALDPDSVYQPELGSLLTKAFGPSRVISERLKAIDGVAEAHLYGSWARRYLGDDGEQPADIDVVVVGSVQPAEIHKAASAAERVLGRSVNATILTAAEWSSPRSQALRTIREGPLVRIEPIG